MSKNRDKNVAMRMMKGIKSIIAGIVFAIIVALCILLLQQHRSTNQEPQEKYQSRINQFIYDGWNFKVGETIAEIKSNLGDPLRVKNERVKNIHDPEKTDEVYEMIYDGFSITVYRITDSQREIITDIAISSDTYSMKWGLHIGSPLSDIVEKLGKPLKTDTDVYIYGTDEAPSYVSFYYKEGIVYRIAWEFYID